MTEQRDEFVLDTGPLSHLAKAGWLALLRAIAGDRVVVIPDVVEDEIRNGVREHPHLQLVLDAEWIKRRALNSPEEIAAFAHFAERLVADGRNTGEA